MDIKATILYSAPSLLQAADMARLMRHRDRVGRVGLAAALNKAAMQQAALVIRLQQLQAKEITEARAILFQIRILAAVAVVHRLLV